ncbi:Dehydroquinase [Auriculariales sp. MPI-PUGE-AT-0066]|nr:Dehydroquinase [Auriculariales sp. MPI-PUGE-AT-0066]
MTVTWLPEVVQPIDGLKNAPQLNTVLLLRGAGHNLTQEIPEGTKDADLTPVQAIEHDTAEFAELLGLKLVAAQSNVEGYLINHLHAARQYGAVLFSPGAYCFSSWVLYDAVAAIKTPVIEVHMANWHSKDNNRKSLIAPVCAGVIAGCGPAGYKMALLRAKELIDERKKEVKQ